MFRMSRTDRRSWREARTLSDLGELTALWLEGRIGSQPGYAPGYGPDPETVPLIPVLAAANRSGYLTTASQPGEDGPSSRGERWEQRAAVEGHVADRALLDRLVRDARRAGLLTSVAAGHIVVTRVDGRDYTAFGLELKRRDMNLAWAGISHQARAEVDQSTRLTIVDPTYGPSDRLWRALAAATR